jgi:hypothetical protein
MNAALPPIHAGIDDLISFLQALSGGCVRNTERMPALRASLEQPIRSQRQCEAASW